MATRRLCPVLTRFPGKRQKLRHLCMRSSGGAAAASRSAGGEGAGTERRRQPEAAAGNRRAKRPPPQREAKTPRAGPPTTEQSGEPGGQARASGPKPGGTGHSSRTTEPSREPTRSRPGDLKRDGLCPARRRPQGRRTTAVCRARAETGAPETRPRRSMGPPGRPGRTRHRERRKARHRTRHRAGITAASRAKAAWAYAPAQSDRNKSSFRRLPVGCMVGSTPGAYERSEFATWHRRAPTRHQARAFGPPRQPFRATGRLNGAAVRSDHRPVGAAPPSSFT